MLKLLMFDNFEPTFLRELPSLEKAAPRICSSAQARASRSVCVPVYS
jgi:hypothetical protein